MQREVIARMMLRGCTFEAVSVKSPVLVATSRVGKPTYGSRKDTCYVCINENGVVIAGGEDIYGAAVGAESFYATLERLPLPATPDDGLFKLEDE